MNSTLDKYDYIINTSTIDITTKKSGTSKLQITYTDPNSGKKFTSNPYEWAIPVKLKKAEIINKDDAFSMKYIGDERVFHSRITFDDDSYIDDPILENYCKSTNDSTKIGMYNNDKPLWGFQWDVTASCAEGRVIDKNGKRTFFVKSTKDTTGQSGGKATVSYNFPINEDFMAADSDSTDFAGSVEFSAIRRVIGLNIITTVPNNDPITTIKNAEDAPHNRKTFEIEYLYDDNSTSLVTDPTDITWHIASNNKNAVTFEDFDVIAEQSGLVEVYCTTQKNDKLITSNTVQWNIKRKLTSLVINQSHSVQKIIDPNQILLNTDYYIPVQKIYDYDPETWDVWDDVGTNISWEIKTPSGGTVSANDATIETYSDANFLVAKINIKTKGTYKIIATEMETEISTSLIINSVKDIISIEITPEDSNYGYYKGNEYKYNILITYDDKTTSDDVNLVKWAYTTMEAVDFNAIDNQTMQMLLKTNTRGEIYAYDPRNSNNKSNRIIVDDPQCDIQKITLRLKDGNQYYTAPLNTAQIEKTQLNKVGTNAIFDILVTNSSGDCVHYGNPDLWEIKSLTPTTISVIPAFGADKDHSHLERLINVKTLATGPAQLIVKFKYDASNTIPGTNGNQVSVNWNIVS